MKEFLLLPTENKWLTDFSYFDICEGFHCAHESVLCGDLYRSNSGYKMNNEQYSRGQDVGNVFGSYTTTRAAEKWDEERGG